MPPKRPRADVSKSAPCSRSLFLLFLVCLHYSIYPQSLLEETPWIGKICWGPRSRNHDKRKKNHMFNMMFHKFSLSSVSDNLRLMSINLSWPWGIFTVQAQRPICSIQSPVWARSLLLHSLNVRHGLIEQRPSYLGAMRGRNFWWYQKGHFGFTFRCKCKVARSFF